MNGYFAGLQLNFSFYLLLFFCNGSQVTINPVKFHYNLVAESVSCCFGGVTRGLPLRTFMTINTSKKVGTSWASGVRASRLSKGVIKSLEEGTANNSDIFLGRTTNLEYQKEQEKRWGERNSGKWPITDLRLLFYFSGYVSTTLNCRRIIKIKF